MSGSRRPPWWPGELEAEMLACAFSSRADLRERWSSLEARLDPTRLDRDGRRLLPILFARLAPLGPDLPHMDLLRRSYAEARSANRQVRLTAVELLRRLRRIEVRPILLKGLALDCLAGSQLPVRPIGDIDLLIPLAAVERTLEVFLDAGWEATDPVDPNALDAKHSCCLQKEGEVEIDLHWSLSGRLTVAADRGAAMADFWERSREADYQGEPARLLHPMHQLLHHVVHGALVESRARVRWLADCATLIERTGADADWPLLVESARRYRVSLQLSRALRCFDEILPGRLPGDVIERLESGRWSVGERLRWRLDSSTVKRPIPLDLLRTFRKHLSNQKHRALPVAIALYPSYLRASGLWQSFSQLAGHVRRRRRERRAAEESRRVRGAESEERGPG